MSDTFTVADVGHTFYTPSGEKVRLEGVLGPDQYDQYVVSRAITIYSGDEAYDEVGEMYICDKLFRKAPIAKKAEELEDLLKAITAAKIELASVNAKIHETEKTSKEILKRCAALPPLQLVMDYLEGNTDKWMCVVVNYRSCKAYKLVDYLTYEDAYDYKNRFKLRLLSLFGNKDGQVAWGMSLYADGSGSTVELRLFKSEAEANDFILQYASKQIGSALAEGREAVALEWAGNHPKAATPEQKERLAQFRIKGLERAFVRATEESLKAREALEKAGLELQEAKKGVPDGTDEEEDKGRSADDDVI